MSSSNIQSTLNFTSSSSVAGLPLPSVFELLAQERLTDLIRPCLQQILKFLQERRPLSNTLRLLHKYKDELILLIEGIIQWVYLHFYSALIGERFYGLRRTADHRLRSLIISVFLPYVKLKLDLLYEQMRMNETDRPRLFYAMLAVLPKVQMFIEGISWLYRIGYAFGRTEYYSPALQLAGVKLIYANEPSSSSTSPSTTSGRFFSSMNKILSSGLFLIQFVDWWNNTNGAKSTPTSTGSTLPLPTVNHTRPTVGKRQCPLCRQPCQVPTAVLGSGYVYCNACISDYVRRYQRCPTTHQPVTNENLIKIY